MRNFNILPLVPHASGRAHNSLIFLASFRALAATDVLRYLTIFNDFPQKSLTSLMLFICEVAWSVHVGLNWSSTVPPTVAQVSTCV